MRTLTRSHNFPENRAPLTRTPDVPLGTADGDDGHHRASCIALRTAGKRVMRLVVYLVNQGRTM